MVCLFRSRCFETASFLAVTIGLLIRHCKSAKADVAISCDFVIASLARADVAISCDN